MKPLAYQQIAAVTTLIHFVLCAVMLTLVVIGWRRHRNAAYLILVIWALASLGSIVMQAIWMPWIYPMFSNVFGASADPAMLMFLSNMLSSLVSGTLLCVGVAMLVFTSPSRRPPSN